MTDDLGKDPAFRSQFDARPTPDPEFEAALNGSTAPRFTMSAAPQPLSGAAQWVSAQMVKLG